MMKKNSINEFVKGIHYDNSTSEKPTPQNSPVDCGGVRLTSVTMSYGGEDVPAPWE